MQKKNVGCCLFWQSYVAVEVPTRKWAEISLRKVVHAGLCVYVLHCWSQEVKVYNDRSGDRFSNLPISKGQCILHDGQTIVIIYLSISMKLLQCATIRL